MKLQNFFDRPSYTVHGHNTHTGPVTHHICLPGIFPTALSPMQGSVLSPLLFILYTTPLSTLISSRRADFDVSSLVIVTCYAVIPPIRARLLFIKSQFMIVTSRLLAAGFHIFSSVHGKFAKEAFVFVHYTDGISL